MHLDRIKSDIITFFNYHANHYGSYDDRSGDKPEMWRLKLDIQSAANLDNLMRRLLQEGQRMALRGHEETAAEIYELGIDLADDPDMFEDALDRLRNPPLPKEEVKYPINLDSDQRRSIEDSFDSILTHYNELDSRGKPIPKPSSTRPRRF